MKKKFIILLLLIAMIFIPTFSLAKDKDPVNIYMFRGQGCGFCKKFLTYAYETLEEKYGDKINIVTYEVWYNEENSKLMDQVASFLGDEPKGVPYIIIGNKTFEGYSESYNSQIEEAIDNLYDSKERYDVFEKMGNKVDLSKNTANDFDTVLQTEGIVTSESGSFSDVNTYAKNSDDTMVVLIWNLIITVIGFIIVIIINVKNKNDILKELEPLKKEFNKNKYKKVN